MIAFPKPRTRKSLKAKKDRAEAAHIKAVRAVVMARDILCRACYCEVADEMHEHPSRAHTRGLPPAQRFSDRICCGLCAPCHRDATAHRIVPLFTSRVSGFAGRVRFVIPRPKGITV